MALQGQESARRFAVVSAVVVAVIAAAVAITIWRYEVAINRADTALDARHDATQTAQLTALFWHEHEAMNEYLVNPSAAELQRDQRPARRVRQHLGQPGPRARRPSRRTPGAGHGGQ